MQEKLQAFINGIKQTTGITLSVYNREGKLLFGEKLIESLTDLSVKDIFCNQSLGVILFPIYIEEKEVVAVLKGTTQTEQSLAVFIREYAEKTFNSSSVSIENFYKGLIFGEYSKEQAQKLQKKFDIKASSVYCIYLTTKEDCMQQVADFLLSMNESENDCFVLLNSREGVFVKLNKKDSSGFVSPKDYASFLVLSVYEETGKTVKISVGNTVETLTELSNSFNQAKQIAQLGQTESQRAVNGIEDFFIIKLLEDLSPEKVKEYYKNIRTEGTEAFFNQPELLETAQAFLENNLNASQTSRKTYLHRNTLNYRLDKIQRLTGLDIRNFYDALALRIIIIIFRMVKN